MLRNVNWFVGLLHYQTQVECFYFYLGLENFGIFESVIYLYLIFLLNIIYLTFLFNNNLKKSSKITQQNQRYEFFFWSSPGAYITHNAPPPDFQPQIMLTLPCKYWIWYR